MTRKISATTLNGAGKSNSYSSRCERNRIKGKTSKGGNDEERNSIARVSKSMERKIKLNLGTWVDAMTTRLRQFSLPKRQFDKCILALSSYIAPCWIIIKNKILDLFVIQEYTQFCYKIAQKRKRRINGRHSCYLCDDLFESSCHEHITQHVTLPSSKVREFWLRISRLDRARHRWTRDDDTTRSASKDFTSWSLANLISVSPTLRDACQNRFVFVHVSAACCEDHYFRRALTGIPPSRGTLVKIGSESRESARARRSNTRRVFSQKTRNKNSIPHYL